MFDIKAFCEAYLQALCSSSKAEPVANEQSIESEDE